jgi:large subunit ribosomal protein L3
MKILLGKKWEMTQVFTEDGRAHTATLVRVEPHMVTTIRTKERDGYEAVQVRAGTVLREFRADKPGKKHEITLAVGDTMDVSQFEEGERITISAVSKGKGFQGGVKRHGFHGASKTHGTKHAHRQPGSIGAGGVQKVLKGQKMAGRMGSDRVTMRGIQVVKVFPKEHMIAIKGGIPGNRGTIVEIRN